MALPSEINLKLKKIMTPRYGENPHQEAAIYSTSPVKIKQYQGKELSYNNIFDAACAEELVYEFGKPAVAIIKHQLPCGVSVAKDVFTAYKQALDADPISAFGGIIAANRKIDEKTAKEIVKSFKEVVIAPSFTPGALEVFKSKKNLRIVKTSLLDFKKPDIVKVGKFYLAQKHDSKKITKKNLKLMTKKKPTPKQLDDLLFAWKVAKHVKSNGVVLVKNLTTVGIGTGQPNRVDAVKITIQKAKAKKIKGPVLASDGFFPFSDNITEAAKIGVSAIVEPGGSMRDDEVITAADKKGIALVFTGIRAFKHGI
ncbi:bifunctional phosphoribosylaminoimidazolecarboxamide formyltransferase/IMP cyclohydrolase [Candidatus Undinarchaeota archaeon]